MTGAMRVSEKTSSRQLVNRVGRGECPGPVCDVAPNSADDWSYTSIVTVVSKKILRRVGGCVVSENTFSRQSAE